MEEKNQTEKVKVAFRSASSSDPAPKHIIRPDMAADQLTPLAGRLQLQKLRPSVSASVDLARARGRLPSGTGEPSRLPGELALFVGNGAHAADTKLLERLGISAVLNAAPSVCKDPEALYRKRGIAYATVIAQDDRSFRLLDKCLAPASAFIGEMHAQGRAVLVHCMAGVNRSATLAVAHLLKRDRRCLFELAAECIAARPCILQNPSFQLQLCELAAQEGLLYLPTTHSHAPQSSHDSATTNSDAGVRTGVEGSSNNFAVEPVGKTPT